jgi:hypothetical protein
VTLGLLGLFFLGLLVIVYLRYGTGRFVRDVEQGYNVPPQSQSPYRCVSVVPAGDSCSAARSLMARRFLPQEAPRLPLADCSCTVCACVFVHYPVGRRGERRDYERHQFGAPDAAGLLERRRHGGRRSTDLLPQA